MPRKKYKYHFIYKTTCTLNETYYVGMHSTFDLEDGYLGSGKRLNNSVKKHGKENFKREILEYFQSRGDLKQKEIEIVTNELLNDPLCMNLKPGGYGGVCDETHLKNLHEGARRFLNNKWVNQEYKEQMSILASKEMKKKHAAGKIKYDTFTGKQHTKETKKLIGLKSSIHQTGIKNSQFGSHWITNEIETKKMRLGETLPIGWRLGKQLVYK